jgi:hypothetical protein
MSLVKGSFTVSYELNGQTYNHSGTNISVYETTNNGITYYTTSLGFNDTNFPFINENNNTEIKEYGIIINIFQSLSNNNYMITGPTTTPSSQPPSITFNTITPSLDIPDDFYKNITVSISYVYNRTTYYNFSTSGKQKTLSQTVTQFPSNGIYSYTYTLALNYRSNSVSNTATFSTAAVETGNTAATLTTSVLRGLDPRKTTITDEEAAEIANSVSISFSHLVSSGENFGNAINKAMKATMN